MDKQIIRESIAKRVAQELKDGDVINLGIGLPSMVADYIPKDVCVTLHGENGLLGMGPVPDTKNDRITNAGGEHVSILPGGSIFDTSMSFGLIRGGHIDVTVLGALEVDQEGNLANWMIPGKKIPGMGGAMDLVVGAKKVIVAMEHTAKGNIKIFKKCSLPLTAEKQVNMIITDLCVIEVTEKGLLLKEVAEHSSVEEVQRLCEAELIIDEKLKYIQI